MKELRKAFGSCLSMSGRKWYRTVYETPSGTLVAKTKHGYYPVTRTRQINKKFRYTGTINDYEVWETRSEKRRSIRLKEVC